MLEILLLEFDLPEMFSDMTNDEFVEWMQLGLSFPVEILRQCLQSALVDLEQSEQYEKCRLLTEFIKTHT